MEVAGAEQPLLLAGCPLTGEDVVAEASLRPVEAPKHVQLIALLGEDAVACAEAQGGADPAAGGEVAALLGAGEAALHRGQRAQRAQQKAGAEASVLIAVAGLADAGRREAQREVLGLAR